MQGYGISIKQKCITFNQCIIQQLPIVSMKGIKVVTPLTDFFDPSLFTPAIFRNTLISCIETDFIRSPFFVDFTNMLS